VNRLMQKKEKENKTSWFTMLVPVVAIALALGLGGIMIFFAGINPLAAYQEMMKGAFGNIRGIGETLTRFVPLLFCGLAFSVAFKAGFYNVGAEGQLYMGAVGALLVGLYAPPMPGVLLIGLGLLSSFFFGAVWLGLSGWMKWKFGANEIINTMMQNYLAILAVELLLKGALRDSQGLMDQSPVIQAGAVIPYMFAGLRVSYALPMALLAAVLMYVLLNKTTVGYELRMLGKNVRVARYAGVSLLKTTVITVLLSGGLAGMAGGLELLGTQFRLMPGFSPGYGFDAIGVAVMAKHNPFASILTALLFSVIRVGAGAMQRSLGVPLPLLSIIQGMIIVFVICSDYLSRRINATRIGGRA